MGFYSQYSLVPKKDGSYRPIRDLSILNRALMTMKLLCARSREAAIQECHLVVSHLHRLGFVVNREKSVLSPSQTAHFLGITLDSASMTASLSQD